MTWLAAFALLACPPSPDDSGDTGPCGGDAYTDFYRDSDGDGFGDPNETQAACEVPANHVEDASDCDDDDPAVHPDATEVCDNGLDDDCDRSPGTCGASGVMDGTTGGAVLLGDGDAGRSVAGAGDTDGDGLDEVLVGAPETSSDAGGAYLVGGPPNGESRLDAGTTTLVASALEGRAGYSVAGPGDIDGDGHDDVFVGAPHTAAGGTAYLLLGPLDGSEDLDQASRVFDAELIDDRAGQAVAGAGDTDGDGFRDLLVGAPEAGRGIVYLVRGPTWASDTLRDTPDRIESEVDSPSTGFALASGDTDGDGLSDVLLGVPQDGADSSEAGAAYLFRGPLTGTLSIEDAAAAFNGAEPLDWAGSAVALGDLDDDGDADLVIGAYRHDSGGTQAGAVYVIYGPADGQLRDADHVLYGTEDQEHVGISLAVVPDHDGDGHADLLVGADRSWDDHGGAWLLTGPLTGSGSLDQAHALVTGGQEGSRAGTSVASAGDVDGDGTSDLLLGVPVHGEGGAAYLVYGGPGY